MPKKTAPKTAPKPKASAAQRDFNASARRFKREAQQAAKSPTSANLATLAASYKLFVADAKRIA